MSTLGITEARDSKKHAHKLFSFVEPYKTQPPFRLLPVYRFTKPIGCYITLPYGYQPISKRDFKSAKTILDFVKVVGCS
jgi:hypothetical protein